MDEAELEELLDAGTSRARAETFQALRPLTTRVLQLQHARAPPAELAATLQALQGAVEAADPRGLRACWDYLMFPLLLLLESVALARQHAPGSSSSSSSVAAGPNGIGSGVGGIMGAQLPPAASDRVAEAVVGCVQAVLERVPAQEDQRLSVLQKLAPLLQLPREAAAEEVRLQAFSCATALLQPPKASTAAPVTSSTLAAEPMAPLVGALIHSCLEAAAAELAAGQRGSKGVRASALRALHALVVAVGSGDALAFFLPGIASGLAKQLLASAGARSAAPPMGAAGGSGATVAALQALVATVQLTLGDAVTRTLLQADLQAQATQQPGSTGNGAQVLPLDPLAALQQLSASVTMNGHGASAAAAAGPDAAVEGSTSNSSSTALPPLPQPQPVRGRLRMQVTSEWVRASAGRVQTVLAMALPPLVTHPRPSVRVALAEGVASLLDSCGLALQQCRQPLLEIILSLAQDEWPQVSGAAVCWLAAAGAGAMQTPAAIPSSGIDAWSGGAGHVGGLEQGSVASPAQALGGLLSGLSQGLPASVRAGEDKGVVHAKRLTTALLYAGPSQVASVLLQRPAALSQLITGLLQCFTFDSTGAALLLHARVPPGSYGEPMLLPAPSPAAVAAGDYATASIEAAGAGKEGAGSTKPSDAVPGAAQAGSSTVHAAAGTAVPSVVRLSGPAAVLLPRMPLGLSHLGSVRAYSATANVARALGRLARLADLRQAGGGEVTATGGSNLRRVMDALLSRLQQAQQQRRRQQSTQTPAGSSWQCEAAAAAAIAAEVMYGASAAWQPPTPGAPQRFHMAAADASGGPSLDTAAAAAAAGARSQSPAAGPVDTVSVAPGGSASSVGALQRRWGVPAVGVADAEFESLLLMMLEAVTQEALWGVPTAQPSEPLAGAKAVSAQELGENALLLRVLTDACGAAARAAGPRLSGRLLRTILLPLLERLSDPCLLVADAADTALRSICIHCGYSAQSSDTAGAAGDATAGARTNDNEATSAAGMMGSAGGRGGLAALVAANADYVVDGVCRQLRGLGRHPHAPQLLAALLRKAGVGKELVPLLAEPAQAAIKGLSILSRRQQPSHILPFLHALLEIAAGVAQEAQAVQRQLQQQLQTLAGRSAAEAATRQEQEEEQERVAAEAAAAAAGDVSGADEARSYFLRRAEQRQRTQERPSGVAVEGAEEGQDEEEVDMEALAEGRKLQLSPEEAEALEVLYRRAYSAALLAHAAADAAGPLIYSDNLRAAVLSLDVSASALHALSASTSALESEQRIFDEFARRPADGALRPARPEPPKLLPAVHLLWGPLIALLRGARRVALLEKGLGLLGEVTVLGGGRFMAQRFQGEAWPLLARLMQGGPLGGSGGGGGGSGGGGSLRSSRELLGLEGGTGAAAAGASYGGAGGSNGAGSASSGAGDDGDMLAPASVERIKAAALRCLERVASIEDASRALQAIVWPVGVAATDFLSDVQPLALREGAGKLLLALGGVDADAVWLLLVDLARNCPDVRLQMDSPNSVPRLPSLQQLLPPMAHRAAAASPRGGAGSAGAQAAWPQADVAAACGRRAEMLLGQIQGQAVRWHQRAKPGSVVAMTG